MTAGTALPVHDAAAPWAALRTRLISAVLLAGPVLLTVYLGTPLFELLVAVAGIVMCTEWSRVCRARAMSLSTIVMAGAVVFGVGTMALGLPGWALAVVIVGAVATAVAEPYRSRWMAAGTLYIGLPCIGIVWLRADPDGGAATVFWLLAVVWAADIGAFAFGRRIGGPKLAPQVSPNKTWAGLLGGIGCAALAGLAFAAATDKAVVTPLTVVSGCLGGVSQAGDLFESWVKRHFGVKDSGTLIPGHGGLLDRVDALMVVVALTALIGAAGEGSILAWL